MLLPKSFDIFSPEGGCSEGLDASVPIFYEHLCHKNEEIRAQSVNDLRGTTTRCAEPTTVS